MKQIEFLLSAILLSATLLLSLVSCGSDEGSSTTRAGIIAEDMVKIEMLCPDDMEWDLVSVEETSKNTFHVIANIKAINKFGMKIPKKVSVRLEYKGSGDWADIYNWEKLSIIYL